VTKNKFIIVFCLILFPLIAHAQGFTGPSTQGQAASIFHPITVTEVRTLPSNSWVVVSGNIVNSLPGGKYFTVRDSTGDITVEIERKVFRGVSANASDTVEIHGYVEISRGQVSIEAKAIFGSAPVNIRSGQAVAIRQPITVSEASSLPNNSWVLITGNIVNEIRSDKYFTFRDSTGEITVEIERKVWRGLSVDVSDTVEIHGYVEINRGQTSIEVKAIRKI
jgi:uncharacterized protein (TIGR00156 family)